MLYQPARASLTLDHLCGCVVAPIPGRPEIAAKVAAEQLAHAGTIESELLALSKSAIHLADVQNYLLNERSDQLVSCTPNLLDLFQLTTPPQLCYAVSSIALMLPVGVCQRPKSKVCWSVCEKHDQGRCSRRRT